MCIMTGRGTEPDAEWPGSNTAVFKHWRVGEGSGGGMGRHTCSVVVQFFGSPMGGEHEFGPQQVRLYV